MVKSCVANGRAYRLKLRTALRAASPAKRLTDAVGSSLHRAFCHRSCRPLPTELLTSAKAAAAHDEGRANCSARSAGTCTDVTMKKRLNCHMA